MKSMQHLDETQLNALIESSDSPAAVWARAHVTECPQCSARLAELRDVVIALRRLPRAADPSRDLWPDIADRVAAPIATIATSPRRWSTVTMALAASVVFAAGLLAGSWLTELRARQTESGTSNSSRESRDPFDAAVDVQRAGTSYAAAIARLRDVDPRTPAGAQGRDAALAVLYVAARELAELAPDTADALEVLRVVSRSHARRVLEVETRGAHDVRF
jgi:hypothetical protein